MLAVTFRQLQVHALLHVVAHMQTSMWFIIIGGSYVVLIHNRIKLMADGVTMKKVILKPNETVLTNT